MKYIVGCLSIAVYLMFPLLSDSSYCLLGERFPEISCNFQHITMYTIFDIDINLDHLIKVELTRFIHCKLTTPFFLLYFLQEGSKYNLRIRSRESCYTSYRLEYLHKLLGTLEWEIHLFLFIYVLFIYFLSYFSCGPGELSNWLLCLVDIHPLCRHVGFF